MPKLTQVNDHKILNNKLTKLAANLLSQQIWCWGRDVECSSGNLLIKHGFQRFEKPAGSKATSIYRLDLSTTSRIILRGYGVFYGDDRLGGLFLHRFEFSPRLSPAPDLPRLAWKSEDLPPLVKPSDRDFIRSQQLLLELIDWIYKYELWIAETMSIEYRQKTLDSWDLKNKVVVHANELASAWRLLGESFRCG